MALLNFNAGNFSDALAGLSQGLLSYGSGNPNGLLTVPGVVARNRQDRLQNTRQQQLLDMEQQKFGLEKTKLQQEQDQYAQHQAAMDALKKAHPEYAPYIDAFGGDAASTVLGQAFPKPESKPASVQEYEYAKGQGFKGSMFDYERQKAEAGRAPQQPPALPSDIQEYNFAKGQGYTGSFLDYIQAQKGGGVSMTMPDGTTVQVGGAGKMTESQGAATAYGKRMWDAENRISKLVGADPSSFLQSMAAKVPVGGNYLLTPEFRQYKQAATDWIRAKLRKESGATISPSELDSDFSTFFPQPGDDPATIAQKADARKSAFEGMTFQAGSGSSVLSGQGDYPNIPAAPAGGPTTRPQQSPKKPSEMTDEELKKALGQ